MTTAAEEDLAEWSESRHTPGTWFVEDGTSVYDEYRTYLIGTGTSDSDEDRNNAAAIAFAVNGFGPALERLVATEAERDSLRAQLDAVDKLCDRRQRGGWAERFTADEVRAALGAAEVPR